MQPVATGAVFSVFGRQFFLGKLESVDGGNISFVIYNFNPYAAQKVEGLCRWVSSRRHVPATLTGAVRA